MFVSSFVFMWRCDALVLTSPLAGYVSPLRPATWNEVLPSAAEEEILERAFMKHAEFKPL